MNEALPRLSNGYDQYNDTDINRARFIFSIEAFVLIPFNISINLLTIIVIFVFKRLQTIQNTFVASMAFGGLLDGLIANPLFAIFWLPDNAIEIQSMWFSPLTVLSCRIERFSSSS